MQGTLYLLMSWSDAVSPLSLKSRLMAKTWSSWAYFPREILRKLHMRNSVIRRPCKNCLAWEIDPTGK